VNRLQSLTPPFSDNSTCCGADRRSDPTPNDTLLLPLQYAYRLRPAWTQARRELHDFGGPFLLPARRVIRVTASAEEMCLTYSAGE
jgi:hypothetical protein